MSAAVLTIGTELMRGEIVDTNAAWLAAELSAVGFRVTRKLCVDDDHERIQAALAALGAEHDLFVCTGGLGPTTDDITAECVARFLEVPLERDAPSLARIRERIVRAGRSPTASNDKQADFPRGARVLPNERGTAPGFAVEVGRARAFFLPGVPTEMEAMFSIHVVPALAGLPHDPAAQVVLRTFGLPESGVNDLLAGIETRFRVTLGYRARFPEVDVKVFARRDDGASAERAARKAADAAREALGSAVFAEGDVGYPEALGRLLVERGVTLGLAESCTGGLLAELLTRAPGSSRFFLGSLVTYANEAKQAVLQVPPALLERYGAVSEEVARSMAEGARRVLRADYALAVTGIAGPGGGSDDKPVGLVHYALAGEMTTARQRIFSGTRIQVRRRAAYAALALLREHLLGEPPA
jgi:nicotinamide-nucleotide amidase